jgi:hypothetical protein
MSKRKQSEMNIQSDDESFACGYKDGERVVKMFKKNPNLNLKSYIDGLYTSYVNTSYNFDKQSESSVNKTPVQEPYKGFFDEPTKMKSTFQEPYKKFSFESTDTPVLKPYKSFNFDGSIDPPVQEPRKSLSFGLCDPVPKDQEPKGFNFGSFKSTPKVQEPKSFSFGLCDPIPKDQEPKGFSFGLSDSTPNNYIGEQFNDDEFKSLKRTDTRTLWFN